MFMASLDTKLVCVCVCEKSLSHLPLHQQILLSKEY